MKPHRKWTFSDFAINWIAEHNQLHEAWERERDRADALARECDKLEADREYNAGLVRERDARIAELEAAPAPVADAKTLEDLAQIGRVAWGFNAARWGYQRDDVKDCYIRQVAAILRAARPVLDLDIDRDASEFAGHFGNGFRDLVAWLNTRIRYRAELPPTECPTCAKVRAALEEKS